MDNFKSSRGHEFWEEMSSELYDQIYYSLYCFSLKHPGFFNFTFGEHNF